MCDSPHRSQCRELIVASTAGVLWSALGVMLSVWSNTPAVATPCRIHNFLPDGTTSVGSGTLIDVAAGKQRGLVLTCAHLFTEGTGRVAVEFPGGRTHGAAMVAVDARADLAALEIAQPAEQPAQVSSQLQPTAALRACGFGPSGDFRCVQGRTLGFSESPGQSSVRIAGAVRSGDSGGGVFDGQGKLCAVVWGESSGVTYASTGRPLAAFLDRVLCSRRGSIAMSPPAAAADCPDGRCPLITPGVGSGPPRQTPPLIAAKPPVASLVPSDPFPAAPGATGPRADCDCGEKLAAITARLDALPADSAASSSSSGPISASSAARAGALLAASALGISGPAGWGVIAAATVGGWFVGRRLKRRKARRAKPLTPHASHPTPAAEATAAAVASFPIERDDREARELLRLSQLEGRDPLQDALAGRLALDRLDALAEGDADPNHATWADRLRRELREKFNEIAPTKFQVNAEC